MASTQAIGFGFNYSPLRDIDRVLGAPAHGSAPAGRTRPECSKDGRILPLTPAGRATERLLKFNLPERVEVRKTLARVGRYPE